MAVSPTQRLDQRQLVRIVFEYRDSHGRLL